MNVEVKQNVFGGQSLWISPGADLTEIPSPYRELICDEHREAFAKTKAYFERLAERCELDGMKQWLGEIAHAGRCSLQIHSKETSGGGLDDVFVRVTLPKRHRTFNFRIRALMGGITLTGGPTAELETAWRAYIEAQLSRLPSTLRMVYELIDGTVEEGFGVAGGISRLDHLYFDYIASDYPIEKGTPPELLESPIFHENSCGDSIVACGEKAYWFLHEICGFREAGNLSEVVSGYFHSLLDGRTWLSDPYASL